MYKASGGQSPMVLTHVSKAFSLSTCARLRPVTLSPLKNIAVAISASSAVLSAGSKTLNSQWRSSMAVIPDVASRRINARAFAKMILARKRRGQFPDPDCEPQSARCGNSKRDCCCQVFVPVSQCGVPNVFSLHPLQLTDLLLEACGFQRFALRRDEHHDLRGHGRHEMAAFGPAWVAYSKDAVWVSIFCCLDVLSGHVHVSS